jgi:hypothetical protein
MPATSQQERRGSDPAKLANAQSHHRTTTAHGFDREVERPQISGLVIVSVAKQYAWLAIEIEVYRHADLAF